MNGPSPPQTYLFKTVWTVFNCKQCLLYFCPDEMNFSLEKAVFWTEESEAVVYFLLFTSQDVNWWTGVMWISFGLLWCFKKLFGLSFWRHPFNAEDPLVSKRCNAKFLQILKQNFIQISSKILQIQKQINLQLGWRVSKFSEYLHFWINYYFKKETNNKIRLF